MAEELSDEELEAQALAELDEGADNEHSADVVDGGDSDDNDPNVDTHEQELDENQDEEAQKEEEIEVADETNTGDEDLAEPKEDDEDTGYGFKLSKPIPIKARGMEFNIGTEKELIDLAHKGFDYFKKTQELAEWRKSIDVLTESGMTLEELQRFADLKTGNKEAVSATLNAYGIDPYTIEESDAASYQPNQMYSDTPVEVERVAEEIRSNPDHADHFKRVAATLPDDFVNEVASNANLLAHFSDHVKRGLAEKIIPEAIKSQIINGGSFMDNYSRIGEAMVAQEQKVDKAPEKEERPAMSNRERELRQKASSPRRANNKPSFKQDADSIWDLSDEEFNALSSSDVS